VKPQILHDSKQGLWLCYRHVETNHYWWSTLQNNPVIGRVIKNKYMYRLISILLSIVLFGCSHAPETGRSQFIAISQSQELQLGNDAYAEVLQEESIVTSGPQFEMVQRVGEKVATAANRLYPDVVAGYQWKFSLIRDNDMVNAWALPGGKCAVYTGLLPVTENEDALAIVMAHEVAHVIARHGAERSSHAMLSAVVAGIAMSEMDETDRLLVLAAYGVGVALPFSRTQETEADQLGLYISADAGYDPREAIPLWERMGKAGSKAPAEFLSTHPTSETRIKQIQGWMPKAMMYYDNSVAHEAAQSPSN
jgi:predicted Zn-dependent protease